MAKHYIRLDGIYVIKSFSTAFEQPNETDVFIEEGGRHYNLNIHGNNGLPNLKYVDGKILEATAEDLQPLIDALPEPPPTVMELIEEIKGKQDKHDLDIEDLKKVKQDKVKL